MLYYLADVGIGRNQRRRHENGGGYYHGELAAFFSKTRNESFVRGGRIKSDLLIQCIMLICGDSFIRARHLRAMSNEILWACRQKDHPVVKPTLYAWHPL